MATINDDDIQTAPLNTVTMGLPTPIEPIQTTPSRRGRGRPRGRGRGRPRATTAQRPSHDISEGWRIKSQTTEAVVVERAFTEDFIGERARLYCATVLGNLKAQCDVRDLPEGRARVLVLLCDPLLSQLRAWLNEFIRQQKLARAQLKRCDMYRFFAVFLLSHCTGFSMEKCVHLLNRMGLHAPVMSEVRFIANHLLAYSPVSRGRDGLQAWNACRDHTQQLTEFETLAFREVRKVFFSTMHLFATLDDDLFGTRAADNQVKTISARKADKEGHVADVLADALFRIVMGLRFRRRGEKQEVAIRRLMENVTDGRGEAALVGLTLTADRGYGKEAIVGILAELGISSMFILPEHLLRCHPFIGQSFLRSHRDDEVDEYSASEDSESEREKSVVRSAGGLEGGVIDQTANDLGSENNSTRSMDPSTSNFNADRKRAFIIDDAQQRGPASFHASKRLKGTTKSVAAVAVREHGTEKFSKVLRFLFQVPESMQRKLETWIAVPRPNVYQQYLFYGSVDKNDLLSEISTNAFSSGTGREELETVLSEKCTVLTVGQRCSDWFVLRQFRVTGTNAGALLASSATFCELTGVSPSTRERTLKEWFDVLMSSWFSTKKSTEAMKRGTVTEDAVVEALKTMDGILTVFPCGMLATLGEDYMACSPDGIALIDVDYFPSGIIDDEWRAVKIEGKSWGVAAVEVKTSVADTTVGDLLSLATATTIYCKVGDSSFVKYVAKEHTGQVMQQMMVLNVNFCIYVRAAECGVVYKVIVYCPSHTLDVALDILRSMVRPLLQWVSATPFSLPPFVGDDHKQEILSRLPFWQVINKRVMTVGVLPPVKVFKHATQSIYSKTKGGVDGATQARAILRSPTSHLKWEQKIVSQVLKTLAVNSFVGWRMAERGDLIESSAAFRSLDDYRHSLNCVQSLADFTFDLSKELLVYADDLTRPDVDDDGSGTETVENSLTGLSPEAIQDLKRRAESCKRGRIPFFNTEDMTKLRLQVLGHNPKQSGLAFCALCGVVINNKRGHMSSFQCSVCSVNLCVRTWPGLRLSCFTMWHSHKQLRPREMNFTNEDIEE